MDFFSVLKGKTLIRIDVIKDGNDKIRFITSEGQIFEMTHYQDCCESVVIEEIHGDLDDLLNNPILMAEESSNRGKNNDYDSETWTFYKLATIKGSVTIRWHGSSNGYYSESVDFDEVFT